MVCCIWVVSQDLHAHFAERLFAKLLDVYQVLDICAVATTTIMSLTRSMEVLMLCSIV